MVLCCKSCTSQEWAAARSKAEQHKLSEASLCLFSFFSSSHTFLPRFAARQNFKAAGYTNMSKKINYNVGLSAVKNILRGDREKVIGVLKEVRAKHKGQAEEEKEIATILDTLPMLTDVRKNYVRDYLVDLLQDIKNAERVLDAKVVEISKRPPLPPKTTLPVGMSLQQQLSSSSNSSRRL